MQSVGCDTMFCQDHTFQVCKNYQKSIGAHSCWDVSVGKGKIACAVLVPSTSVKDVAHAAEQCARRDNWDPLFMYCDTWPNNKAFWELIFPKIIGRLGLFHIITRIYSTLRDRHVDFVQAVNELRACFYHLNVEDESNLLRALKDGTLNGKRHSDADVRAMKQSSQWKRLSRYCRKEIYPSEIIENKLDDWFVRFKVSHSDGQDPGQGRLDPRSGKTLFRPETKSAVENQKKNCKYIQDVLPLDKVYRKSEAPKKAKHNLPTYKTDRGEGSLEGFHDVLPTYGNTNMRESLSDTLHLTGTCRHNKSIDERTRYEQMSPEERAKVPTFLHGEPAFFNDSDLNVINQKARSVGIAHDVHEGVTPLMEDNGERFFSAYLRQQQERNKMLPVHPLNDRCQCTSCANNPVPLHIEENQRDITTMPTITNSNPDNMWKVSPLPRQEKASRKRKHDMLPEPPKYLVPTFAASQPPPPLPPPAAFLPNPPNFLPNQPFPPNQYYHQQQPQMFIHNGHQGRKPQVQWWCQGCFHWHNNNRLGRRPKACVCPRHKK